MLDIDTMRWGCELAEGFSWEYEPFDYTDTSFVLVYYAKERYERDEKTGKIKTSIYKLFLQEVIEAINKKYCSFIPSTCIEQGYDWIEASTPKTRQTFHVMENNYDICKEKAITYVMDHIKDNI